MGPGRPCIDVPPLIGLVELLPMSLLRSIDMNSGVKGAFSGDISGLVLDVFGGASGPPSSMDEIDMDGRLRGGSSRVVVMLEPWLKPEGGGPEGWWCIVGGGGGRRADCESEWPCEERWGEFGGGIPRMCGC